MLRGRDIAERNDMSAPGVVVINEWLAKRYWPDQDETTGSEPDP